MALNKEDKADVKGAMGKAMANKISKVTRDSNMKGMNPTRMAAMEKAYASRGKSVPLRYHKALDDAKNTKKGMSKETMSAAEKGDKGGFIRSFMK